MKRLVLGLYVTVITPCLCYGGEADSTAWRLDELLVTTRKPLKEIGLQSTKIDSAALKENIAQSMADILTYNSALYVKSHGRATMSTIAFRGTSAGHTQVSWNGMRINSPMLGTTDFSTIPSYFIDKADLLHGTSGVSETGGGLGGIVNLGTSPDAAEGLRMQYVQGVGSFKTFDEFAKLSWRRKRLTLSTRIALSTSPNDYLYTNHDRKVNIYDDQHNIVGQYYPRERNSSGAFRDLHILQEAYYKPVTGQRIGFNLWYTDSRRELPLLTTDYGSERRFENVHRNGSLRCMASWNLYGEQWTVDVRSGYMYDRNHYNYSREMADGLWSKLTSSRSFSHTIYGKAEANWSPRRNIQIKADLAGHQYLVSSRDDQVVQVNGQDAVIGYNAQRFELSAAVTARWRPVDAVGISGILRQEICGRRIAPLIPALLADWRVLVHRFDKQTIFEWTLLASGSRNFRMPTLNDLFFMPGGNPQLRNEHGYSCDAGMKFSFSHARRLALELSANVFESRIYDWILWLPTTKGFFSPRNVKQVHAYGLESKLKGAVNLGGGWHTDISAAYSWTPSVNCGPAASAADQSVGRQLPYVPRTSASFIGRLAWNSWGFSYKWAHYSERFTMTSNQNTLSGSLPPYFMNNISIDKAFNIRQIGVHLRLAVNNLFNEDYISVLGRPMPGINYEFFVSVNL